MRNLIIVLFLLFPLSALADNSAENGYGPHPMLPEPHYSPVVNAAKIKGWPNDKTPVAPEGFTVTAYATDLKNPRWLYVLPNGDVLVTETNAPPKPEDTNNTPSHKKALKTSANPKSHKSANRITLLRGIDENGRAKTQTVFLKGLNSPFGMALIGHDFYVADTDALLRFPYHDGDTKITAKGVKVIDLPGGPIDHHWTKNVIASPDGSKLYVTVGSNSNIAENGMEAEKGRAAVWEIDLKTGKSRIFASGLRNPNGLAWQPDRGQLWTTVNERDEIGDDLPPDYMTAVKDGGFYGWPWSYWGKHVDMRVQPQDTDAVAQALTPDYGLGDHTASLGLLFYQASAFPAHYKNGTFIAQHGSWNRATKIGYKVIFVSFKDGKPSGMPEGFLTGFLDSDGNAFGRPVGVAVDNQGALLVADDAGNSIWRVACNDCR